MSIAEQPPSTTSTADQLVPERRLPTHLPIQLTLGTPQVSAAANGFKPLLRPPSPPAALAAPTPRV